LLINNKLCYLLSERDKVSACQG